MAVYLLTLARHAHPGGSARLLAGLLDLLPPEVPAHPLLTMTVRALARIPGFPLVPGVNLLSALAAGLALALFSRLSMAAFFHMACRGFPELQPVLPPLYEDEDDEAPPVMAALVAHETAAVSEDRLTSAAAIAGGAVAGIALAFSVPFWSAAVSLHVQTFDLLLVLMAAACLTDYLFADRLQSAIAALLIGGLGAVESPLFLAATPVIMLVTLVTLFMRNQLTQGAYLLTALAVAAGVGAGLATARLIAPDTGLMRVIHGLAVAHAGSARNALPRVGWLLVLCQTAVPLALVVAGGRHAILGQRREERLLWSLVLAAVTLIAIGGVLNLPGTPWRLASEGGYLPVTACAATAFVTGFAVLYWLLAQRRGEGTVGAAPRFGGAGLALACTLGLAVLAAPWLNRGEADARRGGFADRFAGALIETMGERDWLASDGLLDAHLVLQARQQRRRLVLVPIGRSCQPRQKARILGELTADLRDPAAGQALRVLPAGSHPDGVLRAILKAAPQHADRLAVLSAPSLLADCGLEPKPHGAFYAAASSPRLRPPDAPSFATSSDWVRALGPAPGAPPVLVRLHAQLREYAARMLNDHGVAAEQEGDLGAASSAYAAAQRLHPASTSALLNRIGVLVRQGRTAEAARLDQHLQNVAAGLGSRPSLFDLTSRHGYLKRQPADDPAIAAWCRQSRTHDLLRQWIDLCVIPSADVRFRCRLARRRRRAGRRPVFAGRDGVAPRDGAGCRLSPRLGNAGGHPAAARRPRGG